MSDTVDEFDFHARQLLKKSKTNPLRERMRDFVSSHPAENGLETLRESAVEEPDLSEIVNEEREERL